MNRQQFLESQAPASRCDKRIKIMAEGSADSISCSTWETQSGILSIKFKGYYPLGSQGNKVANEMVKYTLAAYVRHKPKAVLLDFDKLDYKWGDAICCTAIRLAVERHELPLSLPVGVLAQGDTHKALEPLFRDRRYGFGTAGARLFEDREEAMAYLEERLQGSRLALRDAHGSATRWHGQTPTGGASRRQAKGQWAPRA